MLLYMQGVGSPSRRSSGAYQPMPNPSPLRLPNPRWLGREGSCRRSRASYDCLMMDLSGPVQLRVVGQQQATDLSMLHGVCLQQVVLQLLTCLCMGCCCCWTSPKQKQLLYSYLHSTTSAMSLGGPM